MPFQKRINLPGSVEINMEEITSSSPPVPTRSTAVTNREQDMSAMSYVKKGYLFFTASLKEGFQYFKAFFIGLGKKLTARSEKEATEADLQTAKMQVEATDDAEVTKKRLDKTM